MRNVFNSPLVIRLNWAQAPGVTREIFVVPQPCSAGLVEFGWQLATDFHSRAAIGVQLRVSQVNHWLASIRNCELRTYSMEDGHAQTPIWIKAFIRS